MISSLKLSLFPLLLVASVQAKQDPLAVLRSCGQGGFSVVVGLCVGRIIDRATGYPYAATLTGGLLGALVDHYVCGGKEDPHYWWRKLGNVMPTVFIAQYIHLDRMKMKGKQEISVMNIFDLKNTLLAFQDQTFKNKFEQTYPNFNEEALAKLIKTCSKKIELNFKNTNPPSVVFIVDGKQVVVEDQLIQKLREYYEKPPDNK